MSGFIPGRQYRVTHLATADSYGSIDCDFGTLLPQDLGVGVWAELVPIPLPTSVDSVVMVERDDPNSAGHRHRLVLQYEADGRWAGRGGARWTAEQLQSEAGGHLNGEITVLFDAGAAS